MNKKGFRTAAWLVTACMLLGICASMPVSAGAENAPWQGEGTSASPFIIETAEDLAAIGSNPEYLGAYFKQTADIDLAGINWTPISPEYGEAYSGVYDGNGYTISNLTINTDTFKKVGLFGYTSFSSRLLNIKLTNINVVSANEGDWVTVGGLAGTNLGAVVNCSVQGYVYGASTAETGGLAGMSHGTITNSAFSGTVEGGDNVYCVGGLVGFLYGTIQTSFSTADVIAGGYTPESKNNMYVGGLVGASGTVIDSCNTGDVTAGDDMNGNNNIYIGGLAGGEVDIYTSYSTGSVTGGQNVITGGLVALNDYYSTLNSYYLDTAADSSAAGEPLTAEEFKYSANFTNWDFDNIWIVDEGVSPPTLGWLTWLPDRRITADYNLLDWDDIKSYNNSPDHVTESLDLTDFGANGTSISWAASPDGVIDTDYDGYVIRPDDEDIPVVLTATISLEGGTPQTKTFNLTVLSSDKYMVVYYLNGGKGTPPADVYKTEGEEFTVADAAGIIPPDGMRFMEWNESPEGYGTSYQPGDTVIMPDYDIELYAIWEEKALTINYHANNGSDEIYSTYANVSMFITEYNYFDPPEGMQFKCWYTNPDGIGGTAYRECEAVKTSADEIDLYAIWEDESIEKRILEVEAWEGGAVMLNAEEFPIPEYIYIQYYKGAPLRLEALPDPGYEFAFWGDLYTSRIISENPVYETTMGAGVSVGAVFNKIPTEEDDEYFNVVFKDKSGRILQFDYVYKGSAATPPANPHIVGYSFMGWDSDFTSVITNMVISAIYERLQDIYLIEVIGGTLSNGASQGQYLYDMPVTVKANTPPAGFRFDHWKLDGVKVSTKSTFTFFMSMCDMAVEAVFVEDSTPHDNTSFITLIDYPMEDTEHGTITFTAIKNVPSGFTPIECGVILYDSELENELTLDTEYAYTAKAINMKNDMFYARKINVSSGETWHARAYLIYRDTNGTVYTVYSENTISHTFGGK